MTKLVSIIIPARNEQHSLVRTISGIQNEFDRNKINYEILIINDGSTDKTGEIVEQLNKNDSRVMLLENRPPHGIGNAIKTGLKNFAGDYVIIAMADASDDPKDMITYIDRMNEGYDCCFGSRFMEKNSIRNYPKFKLILNRIVNGCISILFQIKYNDTTNAFKCYSKEAIHGIKPILSHHFNITVELPLKAIVRGYSYAIVSTKWYGRQEGVTKLKLKEMGSRYLFMILYVFLEKLLCGKDYLKK